MPPPPGYLTSTDLAKRLGVCGNTLRSALSRMPASKRPRPHISGNSKLYTTAQADAVRAWYEAHGGPTR